MFSIITLSVQIIIGCDMKDSLRNLENRNRLEENVCFCVYRLQNIFDPVTHVVLPWQLAAYVTVDVSVWRQGPLFL